MTFRFKWQCGFSGADKSYFLGSGKVRRGWGLEFQFVKITKPSVSKIRKSVNYSQRFNKSILMRQDVPLLLT